MSFPTISEYQIAISRYQSNVICFGSGYQFIPSKTNPIKIYSYGSGRFAVVFKLKKNDRYYALRCFLSGIDEKQIYRAEEISRVLVDLNDSWTCKYIYYNEGVLINGVIYPALLMEWTDGIPLNKYVSSIIDDNQKLNEVQKSLYVLSCNLSKYNLGHGDIQSENLLVERVDDVNIVLKLIDYDAFYLPSLKNNLSDETGHTSFQHPNRKREDSDERIDRFSFWLILCAIEAIKFDKNLWLKDMQGGFNDEDNFLFKVKDLQYPHSSILINKLRQMNLPSVDFYLNNLLKYSDYPFCDKVSLYTDTYCPSNTFIDANNVEIIDEIDETPQNEKSEIQVLKSSIGKIYTINSIPEGAIVRINSTIYGKTPLVLDSGERSFWGTKVHLEHENSSFSFYINPNENNYLIEMPLLDDVRIDTLKNVTSIEPPKTNTKREIIDTDKDKGNKQGGKIVELSTSLIVVIVVIIIVSVIEILNLLRFVRSFENDSYSDTNVVSNSSQSPLSHEEVIRDFLKAEDARDINEIMRYYDENVIKYYHLSYPTREDIINSYRTAWAGSSNPKNDIQSISKVDDGRYRVSVIFSFLNSKNVSKQVNSNLIIQFSNSFKIVSIEQENNRASLDNVINDWENTLIERGIFDCVSQSDCNDETKMNYIMENIQKYPIPMHVVRESITKVSFNYNDDNLSDYYVYYELFNCVHGNAYATDFIFITSNNNSLSVNESLTNNLKRQILLYVDNKFDGDFYVGWIEEDYIQATSFKINSIENKIGYGEFSLMQDGYACCPKYHGRFVFDFNDFNFTVTSLIMDSMYK